MSGRLAILDALAAGARTGAQITRATGANPTGVYVILRRMVDAGWLTSERVVEDGHVQREYTFLRAGREVRKALRTLVRHGVRLPRVFERAPRPKRRR